MGGPGAHEPYCLGAKWGDLEDVVFVPFNVGFVLWKREKYSVF